MEQRKEIGIRVEADQTTRKGVLSDLVIASSNESMTRLDFITVDRDEQDGGKGGVLTSRVYMTNGNLVALRDMLVQHTQNWKVDVNGQSQAE